jgi:hypothetical protein
VGGGQAGLDDVLAPVGGGQAGLDDVLAPGSDDVDNFSRQFERG